MCLAIPAKILWINKNIAEIESMGVKKEIDITLVPDARKGDYVLVHAGFAIQMIEKNEALAIENYWKEYLDDSEH
jgi:hydrogenase expression/formation protein HypC